MAEQSNSYTISRRVLARLGRTLENPKQILLGIRGILKSQTQACWKNQAFGEIAWPARYPKQKPPKVNIAGAVRDLATGPRIKARRFEDRPALVDEGILKRSISAEVGTSNAGDYVEIGTNIPYAKIHQHGGESKQAITPQIKANLKEYLRFGLTKGGKKRKVPEKIAAIRPKLGFLFGISELNTKVHARPFLGATDTSIKRMEMLIKDTLKPLGAQEA